MGACRAILQGRAGEPGEAVRTTSAFPLTFLTSSSIHTPVTATMEEFKEEEIESILYIGREVSGELAAAVHIFDRAHHEPEEQCTRSRLSRRTRDIARRSGATWEARYGRVVCASSNGHLVLHCSSRTLPLVSLDMLLLSIGLD